MRSKISVIGENGESVVTSLKAAGRADVTWVRGDAYADCAGSEVVVLAEGADVRAAAKAAAVRAAASVIVVATERFASDTSGALKASLFPRPRLFGVAPADAVAAVDAVLFARDETFTVAALCRGELGVEDRVETVPARVGRGGLRAIG
ncbi:MAG TPA: hypothetical protein VN238_05510 [Solirubrobacteraceae bacterium]|nr:hypothetical protein [Solirubrobacteraceae bacterium]